jgi:transposase
MPVNCGLPPIKVFRVAGYYALTRCCLSEWHIAFSKIPSLTSLPLPTPENARIAERLRQAAELLRAQDANVFRVNAYLNAADTVERYAGSLHDLHAAKCRRGLHELSGIGAGFAAAIAEMLETGRWSQLDRLRGQLEPARLFQTVPGVGPELAVRIHDTLGVHTLEELEVVCHDGRMITVPGIGARRAAAIRAALADILERSRSRAAAGPLVTSEPPVAALLEVDAEYREKSGARTLPTIAP